MKPHLPLVGCSCPYGRVLFGVGTPCAKEKTWESIEILNTRRARDDQGMVGSPKKGFQTNWGLVFHPWDQTAPVRGKMEIGKEGILLAPIVLGGLPDCTQVVKKKIGWKTELGGSQPPP